MNVSRRPVIFGITGWKNAGKTTLMIALVQALSARGLCVATVKHAHHRFDIDHKGRDSYRYRVAGARQVAIASARRLALVYERCEDAPEPGLDDVLARLDPADVVLIEGYKTHDHRKIEVRRMAAKENAPLGDRAKNVVALVSDDPALFQNAGGLATFSFNDTEAIADFILAP